MVKNERTMELIEELERIIGNHFHNKQKRGGFYYRYPVHFEENGTTYKSTGKIYDLTPDNLHSVKYTMGANSLYIGDALLEVLDFLEERYNLDFDDLEFWHDDELL